MTRALLYLLSYTSLEIVKNLLERETGLEPATFDLAERCTTIVLPPRRRLAAVVRATAQIPLVPGARNELATCPLSRGCSTTELSRRAYTVATVDAAALVMLRVWVRGRMVVVFVSGVFCVEPGIGLEPTTVGLQNRCSAN